MDRSQESKLLARYIVTIVRQVYEVYGRYLHFRIKPSPGISFKIREGFVVVEYNGIMFHCAFAKDFFDPTYSKRAPLSLKELKEVGMELEEIVIQESLRKLSRGGEGSFEIKQFLPLILGHEFDVLERLSTLTDILSKLLYEKIDKENEN